MFTLAGVDEVATPEAGVADNQFPPDKVDAAVENEKDPEPAASTEMVCAGGAAAPAATRNCAPSCERTSACGVPDMVSVTGTVCVSERAAIETAPW